MSWQLSILARLIDLTSPLIRRGIEQRLDEGKELPDRVAERFGIPSKQRPQGKLLWLHGASLGETNSLIPVIERFLALSADHYVLVTSGSKSSTQQMTAKLPDRAVHQLLPAENGGWIRSFLEHWRPDALVLAEQEFWPRLLVEVKRAGIPSLVVNARLSAKSAKRWLRLAGLGLNVPGLVNAVHCQDQVQASRFQDLGIGNCDVTGNLKFATVTQAPREPQTGNDGRKVIFFAMSHLEDEKNLTNALGSLDFEGFQVLIGPRHVERSENLADQIASQDFKPGFWSSGDRTSDIIIIDQFGVMADVYGQTDVCILGGTFDPAVGGHSPIEALDANVPAILGPYTWAQESIVTTLPKLPRVSNLAEAFATAVVLTENAQWRAKVLEDFASSRQAGAKALDSAMNWIEGAVA